MGFRMERVKGIEPSSLGWEPRALPLSYARVNADSTQQSTGRQPKYTILVMSLPHSISLSGGQHPRTNTNLPDQHPPTNALGELQAAQTI